MNDPLAPFDNLLAIVAAIVEAHGGTVAVDSPVQGGLRVAIRIPAADPDTARRAPDDEEEGR